MRALALGATLAAVLAVAASPAGASPLAYVTQGGFEPGSPVHALAVYDVATGMRVRTIDLPGQATDIAIDPTATRAYVATGADLSVVSLKTGTVLKSIPGVSGDVAVDPAGDRVYVTNDGTSGKVNVVNTATETLASPIAVDPYPRSIVVNPAGTRAYTGDVGPSNSLSVVDLTTDMETAQVFAGFDRPENLGISADGARVYAANFGASAGGTFVSIYEPEPTPMTTPVTVGSTPMGLTTNPAGTRVYVANRDSSSISVIDDATKAVVDTIPISFSPTAIAITPDGKRAVVIDSQDEKLGILDLATRKLVAGPFALTAAGEVAIPPAQPPAAAFKTKPGISREPTAFDASATQGGPIGRYAWTFGDGKHAGGPKPAIKHSYATAGTYTVKLTATNGCDPAAIFGPLGVAFDGRTAFCRGARVGTATHQVVVPKAALAVVQSKGAKVGQDGSFHIRLACVRELACRGTVTLRSAKKVLVGGSPRRVKLASRKFKLAAGKHKRFRLTLTPQALVVFGGKSKVNAKATVATKNPGRAPRRRSRMLTLRF